MNSARKPEGFPIGSLESRAAARLVVQRQESERSLVWLSRKKKAFVLWILKPRGPEDNKPHRSEWFETTDGSRKLVCILWVPRGMSVEEAARTVFAGAA